MPDHVTLQPEQAPVHKEYEALQPENLNMIDPSKSEDRFLDPTGARASQVGEAALTGTVSTPATIDAPKVEQLPKPPEAV